MAGGYIGLAPTVPVAFQDYPIVPALEDLSVPPDLALQMKVFIARNKIDAIVLADEGRHEVYFPPTKGLIRFALRELTPFERSRLEEILGTLGIEPVRVADILLYKIPPGRFARYATLDPEKIELTLVRMRLDRLLQAASLYAGSSRGVAPLTPLRAAQAGFLPPEWVTTSNPNEELSNGLFLRSLPSKDVVIGTLGPKSVLQTVAREYTQCAARSALLPPAFRGEKPLQTEYWMLTIQCSPSQLASAVNQKEAYR